MKTYLCMTCALTLGACAPTIDTGGGAGGAACSSALLGWEPTGLTDVEPFGGAIAYAASLPTLDAGMTCQTVLVGVYTSEGACGAPEAVDVFSASQADPTPPPQFFPAPTTYTLAGASAVDVLTPKASVYHFARVMHFGAGEHPFVGLVTPLGTCAAAGFPACDPERAWHHDGSTWTTLLDESGAEDQLLFGVADCTAVSL